MTDPTWQDLPGAEDLHQFQLQMGIATLGQTMRSLAPMLYSYYVVLKEQGFSDVNAIQLVQGLQTFILTQGQP